MTEMSDILIRTSRPTDESALRRLAVLDSQNLPVGDMLVAEACGEIVAAYSPAAARAVADPFRRTADVVSMLKVRAGVTQPAASEARGGFLPVARAA